MSEVEMDSTEQYPETPTDGVVGAESANGGMTQEEKEAKEIEWRDELTKTEEEVNTLKQVLASKQKRVQELRRLLGVGIVSKLSKDVNQGITRLSESEVMMKANSALKTAGEKTSAAFSTVGKKLEDVKNSEFVKSFEEKVGHAYDSVKAKVGGNKAEVPVATEATEDAKPDTENPQ